MSTTYSAFLWYCVEQYIYVTTVEQFAILESLYFFHALHKINDVGKIRKEIYRAEQIYRVVKSLTIVVSYFNIEA